MGARQVFRIYLALTLNMAATAWAQPMGHLGAFTSQQMLNNVVVIEAGKEHGFGFIIGRFGDVLWVATAAHVVFADLEVTPPRPASNIRVQVRGSPTWFSPAQPPDLAMHDIAFLGVTAPQTQTASAIFWRSNVQVEQLTVGQPLRILGIDGRIEYGPEGAGTIGGTAQTPAIEIVRGKAGQSGAPVATSEGFVGMYQRGAGERVVPISVIQQQAINARRPWEILPAPPPSVAVRLCLASMAGSQGLPDVNGPGGTVKRDALNCVNTRSGVNMLVPPQLMVTCEPQTFNLTRDPQQTMEVRCFVNPAGTWRSKIDGFVTVTARGDIWTIDGLGQSRYGNFSGVLTGVPPTLQVQMRTQVGEVATGNLVVEPRRMHGLLMVNGQSFAVELER